MTYPIIHRWFGYRFTDAVLFDIESDVVDHSETKLCNTESVVVTVIASTFPVSVIITLCYVAKMSDRVIIMAVFTVLFAVILSKMTKVRRVEIFAATAT